MLEMGRTAVVPRFGARLKTAREGRGLTIGQVVARVHRAGHAFEGFTRGQLSRYETGQTPNPDPMLLRELARVYGKVTLDELVDLLAVEREAWAVAEGESPPRRDERSARRRRAG